MAIRIPDPPRRKPDRRRSSLRLLFDEHMSSKVARALYELGHHVYYINEKGHPLKGTSDADVRAHARRQNLRVVTYDIEFVEVAAREDLSLVWYDARGHSRTLEAVAHVFLSRWWELEDAAQKNPNATLRLLKSRVVPHDFSETEKRAIAQRQRRERGSRKTQLDPNQGGLDFQD